METTQTFLKYSIKILLLSFLSCSTLTHSARENVKRLPFYSKFLEKDCAVEVYLPEDKPGKGVWTYKAPMPTARSFLGACVLDGKIYAIGGATNAFTMTSIVEMYDPLSDTWTQKADMPTPRSMLTACVFDHKIYCFGGTNQNYTSTFYPNAEVYDPAEDKWIIINDIPVGRWSPGACALNNRIYVTGGHNGVTALSRVDILKPETNEWTLGEPMQQVRQGHEACVVDGKIYVMGGSWPENSMPKFLSSMEVFRVGSDQ